MSGMWQALRECLMNERLSCCHPGCAGGVSVGPAALGGGPRAPGRSSLLLRKRRACHLTLHHKDTFLPFRHNQFKISKPESLSCSLWEPHSLGKPCKAGLSPGWVGLHTWLRLDMWEARGVFLVQLEHRAETSVPPGQGQPELPGLNGRALERGAQEGSRGRLQKGASRDS